MQSEWVTTWYCAFAWEFVVISASTFIFVYDHVYIFFELCRIVYTLQFSSMVGSHSTRAGLLYGNFDFDWFNVMHPCYLPVFSWLNSYLACSIHRGYINSVIIINIVVQMHTSILRISYYNDQPSCRELICCPMCDREFRMGWYHFADQKLYDHMSHGKGHRRLRNELDWATSHWYYVWHLSRWLRWESEESPVIKS